MNWQIVPGVTLAPDDRSTVIVWGRHEHAVAVLMALLRELGWPAHGVAFPGWNDVALTSALAEGDAGGQQAIIDQRYHQGPRWQLRAPVKGEAFSDVLPRLKGVRYLLVLDAPGVAVEAGAGSDVLPAWLADDASASAARMLIGSEEVLECSDAMIDALAGFVGQADVKRRICARSWQRLYRAFPDLPLGIFKTNGTIDRVVPRGGGGWAYIEGVDAPVDIEIRVGRRTQVVTADQMRPDIKARGFHPSGACGFGFSFKNQLEIGEKVHTRVIGDSRELINSPAEVQSPDAGGTKQPPPAVLLGETSKTAEEEPIELLELPRIKPRPPVKVFQSSLWAFLMREIRARFGTQRGGYLWGFVEPAFQVVVLTLLIRGIKGRLNGTIYGEDFVFFFALGVIPYQMFTHAMSGSGIMAGSGLFNFRQIQPIDVGLVRGFIEFMMYGVVFALMLAIANWLGFPYTVDKPLELLYCIFLLYWFAFSIGLFFDVMTSIVRQTKMIQQVFVRMMYLTSGVIFSIDALPRVMQPYLLWNPLLHIIDQIRATCMKSYPARGDLNYAAECVILLLFISLAFYRRNRYRLF
ncbi:MAG: polysialic acid transporter [Hydrocarboniphaga sp.]|uniref:ABC transporter permease n=1 Tax=Hydrocarboniphaga sp. TaxID=2033016 RepID=UPI00263A37B4|nr:ABC transporter permease [Hydrocarboniphaga sp.]MDB5972492.1 polysialic acid transporter [Hydrocarboniphaga sp.]